jgi:7 transmembrane receptor (rhodopsin family)
MLVIVVLMFVLCWLPLHCFFLAVDFFPEKISEWRNDGNELNFSYTFLAIHFLAMSSSFVNPLIYSFMSQNFRVIQKQ